MEKATRELTTAEDLDEFDLTDLEFLLETATEELEQRVTPEVVTYFPVP